MPSSTYRPLSLMAVVSRRNGELFLKTLVVVAFLTEWIRNGGVWWAAGAPADAEVKQFPGFHGQMPSKHYAGYVVVGEHPNNQRHLYYYFATSERNPSQDPVTLWINGGPRCSGLDAFVHQLGPFKIYDNFVHSKEEIALADNHFSLTKVSNLLLVDSPVGTGYSYADRVEDYTFNDTATVSDMHEFTMKWFSLYSEFLSNPFYLGGSSYGGVYIPAVAQEIAKGIESKIGFTINFKGYTMGNGGIDLDIENNGRVLFAHKMGLISDDLYESLTDSCGGDYWKNEDQDCLKNLEAFHYNIQGINMEHILTLPCHFHMGIHFQVATEHDQEMMESSANAHAKDSLYCQDYNESPKKLFDSEFSRRYLHAMPIEVTGSWIRCNRQLPYERDLSSLILHHKNLTMKGYRAFIYNGDHDMVIPYTSTLKWIKMLNYSEIEAWRPWFVDEQIAGFMVRFDHNMLFATFKGAGHTVHEYMPREALAAYHRWIDGDEAL